MTTRIQSILRSEHGAATIVEYTIVFPLVMVIVCILVFTGYLMYDKASMEAAVERTALYLSKTVADQNYSKAVERSSTSNEIDGITVKGNIEPDPYRHLFGNAEDSTETARGDALDIIRNAQLLRNDTVDVQVKISSGIFKKVTVTATETFEMPTFIPLLELPSLQLKAESTMYVNEPAELVRNADHAIDLLQGLDAKLGITEKLNMLKEKISFFHEQTDEGSKKDPEQN